MITWNLDPSNYDEGQLKELYAVVRYLDVSIANEIQEYLDSLQEEETIPITIATIKSTCGWSKYCDVTGSNHYMLNEFSVSEREIRDVKISQARLLGLYK